MLNFRFKAKWVTGNLERYTEISRDVMTEKEIEDRFISWYICIIHVLSIDQKQYNGDNRYWYARNLTKN